MKKAIGITGAMAAALLTSSPAMAQDSDLGGPYIGVFGGIAIPNDDNTGTVTFDRGSNGSYGETVTTGAGADAFSPGFCGGPALTNAAAGGCTDDDKELELGVRAGYDWRIGGSFIAGVLIEGTLSQFSDSTTAFSTTPANYTFTREIDYTAALRARLGYATGLGLFYATGGVAAAKMDNSFTTSNTANSFTQNNPDDWATGYQLGGGAEFGISSGLRLGVEYLYNDFKNDDYSVSVGTGTAPPTNPFVLAGGVDMKPLDENVKFHSLRATLSWGF